MNRFQWIISKRLFFLAGVLLLMCLPSIALAETDSAQADVIPWSGYWWPENGGGLATGIGYRGHPAPIEKYELFTKGSYPGPASQWYLEHDYDPDAPPWYGLCEAWASASVYEPIEFYPSVIENVIFRVGDKKGLITACHQHDLRIRANAHSPEVFHLWLLQYIKDQGRAIHADLDPGEEVWNYPIYQYKMDTVRNGDSLDVTCQIEYADDLVEPDFQGTRPLTEIYTYRLLLSNDEIAGGEWTGASRVNHPEQLALPIEPYTANPYLDYRVIRQIAESRDDELESDGPSELNPGRYNLILLNPDQYLIPGDIGDQIILTVEKLDEYAGAIALNVHDADGNLTLSTYLTSAQEDVRFVSENPPYLLTFSRESYEGGGIYYMMYELKKSFEYTNMNLQKGYGWGGFAITNPRETEFGKIYLVGYTSDGLPMETYAGPLTLSPFEKRIFMISDFKIRNIEKNELSGIKILAPSPVQVLNLSGMANRNMSCYTSREGSQQVIPDLTSVWNMSKSITWGIYNPNMETAAVHMELFSREGERSDVAEIDLQFNKMVHYSGSSNPFGAYQDESWALIQQPPDGFPLKGYVQWTAGGIAQSEHLSPLSPGHDFFIPHVADTSFWRLTLTVINLEDGPNPIILRLTDGGTAGETRIELNPKEKREIRVKEYFPEMDETRFNKSSLFIQGVGRIAGFYTFDTDGDYAHFPLLNRGDIHSELVLPHIASNEYWWTAVNLFNPGEEAAIYRILPYDYQGRLMTSYLLENQHLDPEQKSVFMISELFGPEISEISFIKIQVQSGPGLAGVYAYGNMDCTMLSGKIFD
jgi:hypothetical protein